MCIWVFRVLTQKRFQSSMNIIVKKNLLLNYIFMHITKYLGVIYVIHYSM